MHTCETRTDKKNWKNLVPPRKTVFIRDFDAFNNHLVLTEKKKDNVSLRVIDRRTMGSHYISFDERAYSTGISSFNLDPKLSSLRYYYESMTTPTCHYSYNMDTRKRRLLKQEQVMGGYKASDYLTDRIYAKSRDGKNIPISLVYNKKAYENSDRLLL